MITIEYDHGDVSLLAAIVAGKQLIQHRAVGTECVITQTSEHTLVRVTLKLETDLTVSEEIVASPVPAQQLQHDLYKDYKDQS